MKWLTPVFCHLKKSRLSHKKDRYSFTSKQLWTITLACISSNSFCKTHKHHKHCSPENRKTLFPQDLDFPLFFKALFCNALNSEQVWQLPSVWMKNHPRAAEKVLAYYNLTVLHYTVSTGGIIWMARKLILSALNNLQAFAKLVVAGNAEVQHLISLPPSPLPT